LVPGDEGLEGLLDSTSPTVAAIPTHPGFYISEPRCNMRIPMKRAPQTYEHASASALFHRDIGHASSFVVK